MSKHFTDEDDALLDDLGVKVDTKKKASHTLREERIIAGFEDIQRFTNVHGHAPQYGENNDIFERIYAVRLDRLRELPECRQLIEPLDFQELYVARDSAMSDADIEHDDDALLAELGVEIEVPEIVKLRHVRSVAEKKVAEEIANRKKCEDFNQFKPLFEQVHNELRLGIRTTRPFEKKAEITPGRFFIVGGQKAYVAEMNETFHTAQGMTDARLRVIFDNCTESNMLMRSLQRALHKDDAGRRITDPVAGPLFTNQAVDGDEASGTIYVLRSGSTIPAVQENRSVLHKIGVTSGKVERRIANAKNDATFLLADVEIVATYELFNINRKKLENLIHLIFEAVRLNIEIKDRFGTPVTPREWFLVPLPIIDEVVDKIKDGSICNYIYDPSSASLLARSVEGAAQ